MSSLPTQPLTVIRLEVDSFKRLKAANVSPSPTGLIPVRGKNAAGKSSLIESMIAALCGRRGAQELPILEGEHGAHVLVDLGDLVIRRHWTRDSAGKARSTLSVQGADGSEIKSPQAILDALVGEFADPVAFLEMKPEEQVKVTLQVLGLGGQVNGLEREATELFDRRRDLGRDRDRLSKASAALVEEIDGLPAPPSVGTLESLTTELQRIKDHNAGMDTACAARAAAQSRGQEAADRLGDLLSDQVALVIEIGNQKNRVANQRTAWTEANAALDGKAFEDPAPVVEHIKAHEEFAKHAARQELMEQAQKDSTDANVAHAEVDMALEAKRTEIRELLAATPFPMEGVSYDADTKRLMVGAVPFAQASQGERLKLAATIAMMGSPTIKVMFAREGSMLDSESQAQLAAIAEENGFQLWLEVVDAPDPKTGARRAGIWIEDGEAEQLDEDTPAV